MDDYKLKIAATRPCIATGLAGAVALTLCLGSPNLAIAQSTGTETEQTETPEPGAATEEEGGDPGYFTVFKDFADELKVAHEDYARAITEMREGQRGVEEAPETIRALISSYEAYVDQLDDESEFHGLLSSERETLTRRISDRVSSPNPQIRELAKSAREDLDEIEGYDGSRIELIIRLRASVREFADVEELLIELEKDRNTDLILAAIGRTLSNAEGLADAADAVFEAMAEDLDINVQ